MYFQIMATSSAEHSAQVNNLSKSRYTDIKEEPVGKLLTPIGGYQNEPLLALEETLSPVSHFFIDLEQDIWIAKYNCQNPEDSLKHDESAAIHLYTMQFESGDSLYIILNRFLPAEKHEYFVIWFKFLKLFITGLLKLTSVRATVWCGVQGEDLSQIHQLVTECLKAYEQQKNHLNLLFWYECRITNYLF